MKTQIKRTVSVVMAILMLIALAPISDLGVTAQAAETVTFKYEVSNGEATIVRFYYGEYDEDEDDYDYDDDESYDYKYYSHEYGGDLVIPDKLGGYPVTHIGYEAFGYGCDDLTSITIPDSVTSIDDYAFYYCYSLKSITIPDSVTSIDDYAFGNCYSLTSIKIGSGVTSIGDSAFDGCRDLESIKVSSNNKKYSSANGVLFNKNKTTIIRYPEGKSATSYTIPDSVTSIDDGAFEDCRFKSITIPDSVTSIASNAFQECGLKSVKIGSGVKSIGWRAFYDCTGLTKITISDNVTEISDEAFSGTGYYKNSSNWKNGVLYIGNHLIKADKESIKGSYKIKSGTKCIADWAFSDCTGLTSVTIPDSVTSIGGRAFDDCSSLTSVKIGSGVKSIGVCAFFCCGLTSITIPDSVTSIGDSAFDGCNNLKSITIPDSVTSIGNSAFYGCRSLKSITIPDSVTNIGNSAFYGCRSLKSITIPDSVTSIGESAFNGCSSLTSIKVSSNNKKYSSANGVLFNKNKTTVIKYPVQKSATSYTIPSSVTSIDYEAFSGCNNLKSITIPDSVTSIGSSAFYKTGYYNNSSNWKNGVLYIGNHLIEAKESIKGSYKIKSGTKCIADSAFYDCTDLKSITIPNSVTSIGDSAFNGCSSLTSITIPDSVTSIGYGTFSGCNNLKSITIPNSVTSIGDYSFEYCSSLKSITIPNSVTSIGEDAFSGTAYYNNSSNWKNGVLYIGNHLIKAKNSIKGSYKIKSGTKCIADFAFWYCTDLKSITIPDSVTSIGDGAFEDCTSLTSITIPDSVTSIGSGAFYGCTGLTSITIPGSVKAIGENAFGYVFDNVKYKAAPISGFTIKGHKGSAADTYAKKNNFKFVSHKNNYTTKVTTKATTSKNGKITYTCDCGYKFKKSIAKIASVKLSHTSYTYNGKAKQPTVTVKDSKGNTLKKGTDYTVKYSSGRKNVGKYTVTVTFKGKYSGTKKLTFKIVPKSTSISKLTSGTKKFTVNVKKQSTQTTGYQIQYSKNSNMKNASTKTFANTSKTSRTITGLKSSTKYYVQVRTYKNVKIDGKTYKYYSSWSSIKSVKTK